MDDDEVGRTGRTFWEFHIYLEPYACINMCLGRVDLIACGQLQLPWLVFDLSDFKQENIFSDAQILVLMQFVEWMANALSRQWRRTIWVVYLHSKTRNSICNETVLGRVCKTNNIVVIETLWMQYHVKKLKLQRGEQRRDFSELLQGTKYYLQTVFKKISPQSFGCSIKF